MNISNMTATQIRVMNFLGTGIEPARIASVVGCSPSYISELMADKDFMDAVQAKRVEVLEGATNRDARLNGLEDALITKTEELVKSPLSFLKPMEAVRALQIVNSLKRRGVAGDVDIANAPAAIVNLTLPAITVNTFVVDNYNKVVKIDNEDMITMPSQALETFSENHNDHNTRTNRILESLK